MPGPTELKDIARDFAQNQIVGKGRKSVLETNSIKYTGSVLNKYNFEHNSLVQIITFIRELILETHINYRSNWFLSKTYTVH